MCLCASAWRKPEPPRQANPARPKLPRLAYKPASLAYTSYGMKRAGDVPVSGSFSLFRSPAQGQGTFTQLAAFGGDPIDDVGLHRGNLVLAHPADGLIINTLGCFRVHHINGTTQP